MGFSKKGKFYAVCGVFWDKQGAANTSIHLSRKKDAEHDKNWVKEKKNKKIETALAIEEASPCEKSMQVGK